MSEYIFVTNIFEYSNIWIYSSHSDICPHKSIITPRLAECHFSAQWKFDYDIYPEQSLFCDKLNISWLWSLCLYLTHIKIPQQLLGAIDRESTTGVTFYWLLFRGSLIHLYKYRLQNSVITITIILFIVISLIIFLYSTSIQGYIKT